MNKRVRLAAQPVTTNDLYEVETRIQAIRGCSRGGVLLIGCRAETYSQLDTLAALCNTLLQPALPLFSGMPRILVRPGALGEAVFDMPDRELLGNRNQRQPMACRMTVQLPFSPSSCSQL